MVSTSGENILIAAVTAARAGFAPEEDLAAAILRGGATVRLADLNYDSLAWMEFCISVELNTGVELTPDHLVQCESLADVSALIEALPAS